MALVTMTVSVTTQTWLECLQRVGGLKSLPGKLAASAPCGNGRIQRAASFDWKTTTNPSPSSQDGGGPRWWICPARLLLPVRAVTVRALLAVGFFPFALWTSFLAAAVRARLYLGFWPSYDHPDPKQIPQDAGPIPEWIENAVPVLTLAVLIGVVLLV